jgi:GGDEF domain-containing protein
MDQQHTLIEVIARAARRLASPDADRDTISAVLAEVRECTGGEASFDAEQLLVVRWPDGGGDQNRVAFEQALGDLIVLAREALGRSDDVTLDPQSFLAELERCASAARWRDRRLSLCVFDVEGLTLGPGVDETRLVDLVGAAAGRSVRQGDVVGHLGAGRFALLFPRAGTFEARAAYKRVRDAVGRLEMDGDGLACAQAGFAELEEDGTQDLLAAALERLRTARVRHAYTGPIGPGSPTTPLAG